MKKPRRLASHSLASRRWRLFLAQRRAVVSGLLLFALSGLSLTAELWSNSRPIAMSRGGHLYFPVLSQPHPRELGITDRLTVDYRKLAVDWAIWPVNRWDPLESNKSVAMYPAPPSRQNWLGTDDRGRDILARLIYGFRYSLAYAVLVWALSSAIALVYGGLCGFLGGWVDLIGQRAVEVLATVPQILLLMFLISIFDPSLGLLIAISCAFGWIGLSYYVRGEALRARNLDFVEAARAAGASPARVFLRHVLPNTLIPLVTFAPFTIVANIVGLAGLDYLGLGLPAPTPSWGELLQQSQAYFGWAWWLAVFPSGALFLALLSLTFLGDGIRQAFDPRQSFAPREEVRAWDRVRTWVRGLRWAPRTGDVAGAEAKAAPGGGQVISLPLPVRQASAAAEPVLSRTVR